MNSIRHLLCWKTLGIISSGTARKKQKEKMTRVFITFPICSSVKKDRQWSYQACSIDYIYAHYLVIRSIFFATLSRDRQKFVLLFYPIQTWCRLPNILLNVIQSLNKIPIRSLITWILFPQDTNMATYFKRIQNRSHHMETHFFIKSTIKLTTFYKVSLIWSVLRLD